LFDDFPTKGITLDGFKAFISSHEGETAFANLRTSEVCKKFLLEDTADSKQSYCDTFSGNPLQQDNIGQATAFVSHSWQHNFLDLVAALEAYESKQATPTVFWFDVFSNNQHKAVTSFEWYKTVFRNNIGLLRKTLLVLEWEDPKPIKRAWCLWEMASTVQTNADFQILMSPTNISSFSATLVSDFESIVLKTCRVNLRTAEASRLEDQEKIFLAVETTIGFEEVNKQVIGIMREWMARSGSDALQRIAPEDRATSPLQRNLARLFQEQGEFEKAAALFREALQAQRLTFLLNFSNFLDLLKDEGNYKEATKLLKELLDTQRHAFGDNHPKTLASIHNLASLLSDQGRTNEAEPLLRESLVARRRTLGDQHPDTLRTIDQLGVVLWRMGRLTEAESLFREAFEGRSRALTLGEQHPDTKTTKRNLEELMAAKATSVL